MRRRSFAPLIAAVVASAILASNLWIVGPLDVDRDLPTAYAILAEYQPRLAVGVVLLGAAIVLAIGAGTALSVSRWRSVPKSFAGITRIVIAIAIPAVLGLLPQVWMSYAIGFTIEQMPSPWPEPWFLGHVIHRIVTALQFLSIAVAGIVGIGWAVYAEQRQPASSDQSA